jgi:hypothetical protein
MASFSTSASGNPDQTPRTRQAQRQRLDSGRWLVCFCLLVAGLGTFALDRALRETDTAPEDPIKSGQKPILPPTTRQAWMPDRSLLGEPAADFQLPDFDDGHVVSLASLRARRPVVLIFGSFSCDLFVREAAAVERLYRAYKDQAEFLFIYVAEAGHDVPELDSILAAIPSGPDHRRQRVQKGRQCLRHTMPTVLDTDDRAVLTAYDAFPRRLVVVDLDGCIAVDLGKAVDGPGWDLSKIEAWLLK